MNTLVDVLEWVGLAIMLVCLLVVLVVVVLYAAVAMGLVG